VTSLGITTIFFTRKLFSGDNPIDPENALVFGASGSLDRIVKHQCKSDQGVAGVEYFHLLIRYLSISILEMRQ
jgi:hypothetical protein